MGNKPMGKRKHAQNRQRQSENKRHRLTIIKPHVSAQQMELTTLTTTSYNPRKEGPYSNADRILLLGEGNFSFALALSTSIGGARITATSYDAYDEVITKYEEAQRILRCLTDSGVTVHHEVDAQALHHESEVGNSESIEHQDHGLCCEKFDLIVFNFPHVGGSVAGDVEVNIEVLKSMFASTRLLLNPVSSRYSKGGQVHVTLRDTPFYQSWNIEKIGNSQGFALIRTEEFESDSFERLGYAPRRTNPAVREAPSVDNAHRYVFSIDESNTIESFEEKETKQQPEGNELISEGQGPAEEENEITSVKINKKQVARVAKDTKAQQKGTMQQIQTTHQRNQTAVGSAARAALHAKALIQSSITTKPSALGEAKVNKKQKSQGKVDVANNRKNGTGDKQNGPRSKAPANGTAKTMSSDYKTKAGKKIGGSKLVQRGTGGGKDKDAKRKPTTKSGFKVSRN
ncbi:hypothetical protein SARC_09632 [Sphaeroforma arctica JP610]|uniref:25S rRNA (uridine-N(3))-methyltransferase BMT5-like domain-containing protein n=1 Tax=Sphaeroforma arctica JP610 TaxID=667725 RepID=A0A0L0FMB5_9EUKA|nr:hypothetical protein SARC_09632 [Sphaeroforma arctica JP610]KNC77919.1 hypothetical protein SARC_09632 [Sphaeroforma arctica JP610]|eukprot:XP_014151821.1 hypothetical protein SARC_09632 [Sphaeroforma arctica JP610]